MLVIMIVEDIKGTLETVCMVSFVGTEFRAEQAQTLTHQGLERAAQRASLTLYVVLK
jgi:hypothetical protein